MSHPPRHTLRNIGIISHIDAGKTTVSERILFYAGEIHKIGEVHDGLATMDWMEQEQERGITITATATSCRWGEAWINLIDTPGHIDFTIEVERSLRVLDGAIAIFSGVEGVQPQSESVWRQADRYQVPRICLINKLDRIGADYRPILEQMAKRLGARPLLLQLPLGEEGAFHGVVDLVAGTLLTFAEGDLGSTVVTAAIPQELQAAASTARAAVIEAAADFDDGIMAAFLDNTPVAAEPLRQALRRGVLAGLLHPVFLGSALRNKGIQPLLDAVVDYLPSPLDIPPPAAHAPANPTLAIPLLCAPTEPLCALAFKVVADEGRKLTYLRLYSGTLKVGDTLVNGNRGGQEKAARLFRMHAHRRERIDSAIAGDIVAVAGLRDALTGDTLCAAERPLRLSGLTIPEPVVALAVEARSVEDREHLPAALDKLLWEDPTFRVHEDPETGQTILTGMGELHLEIITERLRRDFGVAVKTGQPQVVLRETIGVPWQHHELFHRESDGKSVQGDVLLRLTPLPRGSGLQLELDPDGTAALPPEWQGAVRESLHQACASGPLAGYPLTDLRVELLAAPLIPGVTSEAGLRAAAQRGLMLAIREASPTLLEPIMSLELTVPGEHAGKVIGGLQQKRGRVEGFTPLGDCEVIQAKAPLAGMFGYMTELRSATKGRGSFTMTFSHFDQAPKTTLERFALT